MNLKKLQNIDKRILYILLAVVIVTPLFVRPSKHPDAVFDEVQNAFNTIDNMPDDKVAFVSIVWGPGTIAENRPQTEVLMRHLFMKHKKFVVLSWDMPGTKLSYDVGKALEEELGMEYGKDWCHLGYRPAYVAMISRAMGEDFQKQFAEDYNNKPLKEMPLPAKIKSAKDIGIVIDITPSATMGTWLAYFCGPYNVPIVTCPTAVMSAEAYPYLDSGQVSGMLNGVIGASMYETLIGRGNTRTEAAATAWSLSCAHIYIILLIVLGNIGYIAAGKKAKR
ncbi:MAG: hypothetical protein J6U98_00830 [Abditibacteriota bacterium]|nr:hypothetical protein [Abditibacteriota bacterium]